MKIRIIIASERTFNDFDKVEKSCHKIFNQLSKEGILTGNIEEDSKNIEIISGYAKGTNTLGEKFANKYGIEIKEFPAKWDDFNIKPCIIRVKPDGSKYNLLAGVNRNSEMGKYTSKADYGILIAFWDGKTTEIKNMINVAIRYNLRSFIENI